MITHQTSLYWHHFATTSATGQVFYPVTQINSVFQHAEPMVPGSSARFPSAYVHFDIHFLSCLQRGLKWIIDGVFPDLGALWIYETSIEQVSHETGCAIFTKLSEATFPVSCHALTGYPDRSESFISCIDAMRIPLDGAFDYHGAHDRIENLLLGEEPKDIDLRDPDWEKDFVLDFVDESEEGGVLGDESEEDG